MVEQKIHFWNVAFLQVSKYIAYDYDVEFDMRASMYFYNEKDFSVPDYYYMYVVCDMCLMCTQFKVFLFSTYSSQGFLSSWACFQKCSQYQHHHHQQQQ